MIIFLLKILYFILPSFMANMAPINFRKINFLNFPIDRGRTFYGQPLFGKNKTYRGFFFGIISAVAFVLIQQLLYQVSFFKNISLINYENENFLILGFLFGFGALFGDLVESFIKRRLNKKSSQPWMFFDQVDFIIGSLVFVSPIITFSYNKIAIILFLTFFLTIITNHISYTIGCRFEPW